MAAHGTEREASRRLDYLRSESMAQNERLNDLEARLREVHGRLDALETQVSVSWSRDERFGIWG